MNTIFHNADNLTILIDFVLDKRESGMDSNEIVDTLLETELLEEIFSDEVFSLIEQKVATEHQGIITAEVKSGIRLTVENLENEYQEKVKEIKEELSAELTKDFRDIIEERIARHLENPEDEFTHDLKVPELIKFAQNLVFRKLMEQKQFQKKFLKEMISDAKKVIETGDPLETDESSYYSILKNLLVDELKKDKVLMKKISEEMIFDISKTMFEKD